MTSHRITLALSLQLTLSLALASPTGAFAFTPPSLHNALVDDAGMLNAEQRDAFEVRLTALRAEQHFTLVVFIARSLQGESVEDAAYETFNRWGVGQKGVNDGVLLLIAPHERRVRIETGKGMEKRLTDIECGRILRETILPALRAGGVMQAIDHGIDAIIRESSPIQVPPRP